MIIIMIHHHHIRITFLFLITQVAQAKELRQQIDKLPSGAVKDHMSKALRQLEGELGMPVPSSASVASSRSEGGGGGEGDHTWELKINVEDGGRSQSFVLKVWQYDNAYLPISRALTHSQLIIPPSSSYTQELHPDTTIGVLKAMVEEKAGVSAESQEIRLSPSKQMVPGDDK